MQSAKEERNLGRFLNKLLCGLLYSSSSSSSSSSRNWSFDVFPSFSGEDVRKTFLSHFLKELDRKLITAFKDNEIKRSRSLDPKLRQTIKDSRIAVVMFSKNYASSSWCLNELLEIVKCKEECGQMVIPVFYGLDPSHVRKQTGDFGKIFEKTCQNKTEEEKTRWKGALTDVANILGYHSATWANEASMIEEIANDVLGKLNLYPSGEFEDFVGTEDHISEMSSLLHLESEEVRMVGIWGPSGIGKTTIARALFNRLSRLFQSSVFIDKVFISTSMEVYRGANLGDYNMKLHLQRTFLAEVLDKRDVKTDHIGAVEKMLRHRKALIFIDDLDDQDVLDALVGRTQWFGSGSRIIVVTKDRHFLRAHGIRHIYEVRLPSKDLALEMFCRYAFRKNSPPDGFRGLASEVVSRAGDLPLGLEVLGSNLRGRNKEDWMDMLPRLRNGLDGKIQRTLRVSYDGLNNKKDKAIFRHISCMFNGKEVEDIKMLLADSDLDVNIGLKNLVDKSLVRESWGLVKMHSLLQDMGKEIVRTQSDEPGEREFLMDSKDICDVLEDNNGTKRILGISLDIDDINEIHVHGNAFKRMHNLRFLKVDSKRHCMLGKPGKLHFPDFCDILEDNNGTKRVLGISSDVGKINELHLHENPFKRMPNLRFLKYDTRTLYFLENPCKLHLPKNFNYFPPKLKYFCWYNYPLRCMPSNFRPENLVKLVMRESNLEKLWEGVVSLTCLNKMDLTGSKKLKEIPDLSKATNLKKLNLGRCSSLLELPSSIRNLNKLRYLNMESCKNLKILPTGIYLNSLYQLDLTKCSSLRSFPEIPEQHLSQTDVDKSPFNLHLEVLDMTNLKSEKLWEGMEQVQPFTPLIMRRLDLSCIPDLVELLPSSFQNLHKLEELVISNCKNLETLPTGINLQSLSILYLRGCSRLRTFPDISTNISIPDLEETWIKEVPWWIEKFSWLSVLSLRRCDNLRRVSINILKLKHLEWADFSKCGALTEASWDDSPSVVAVTTDNIHSRLFDEDSSSLPDGYISMGLFDFTRCLNIDTSALLQQQTVSMGVILSGEEVPSYFTHRTTGTSLTNIPLPHIPPSQPFIRFKACALCDPKSFFIYSIEIQVCFRFIDISGNHFVYTDLPREFTIGEWDLGGHLVILDSCVPLNKDITPLADQLNYDQVDIQFRLTGEGCDLHLKGCGIQQILENGQSLRNCNPNILPHVCGGNTNNNADEDNVLT